MRITLMRVFAIGFVTLGANLIIPNRAYPQEGNAPTRILRDSLLATFLQQARTRFQQAGAETTSASWNLLRQQIEGGTERLLSDGLNADRLARARQSLNTFVDWMIEAADSSSGAKVVGEGSFASARRRCPPPKYPFCP